MVKDFASDLIALQINSASTVTKTLDLEEQGNVPHITLDINLFLMRKRLYTVNCKGNLKEKVRVTLLWSSFIFSSILKVYTQLQKERYYGMC